MILRERNWKNRMHSRKRSKKQHDVDEGLKASVLTYKQNEKKFWLWMSRKKSTTFSLSFPLVFSFFILQLLRCLETTKKYFFTFLQCRWVGESSLAFHIDLLCVLYNLISWLLSVSSIYSTTCTAMAPPARSTGELLGTSLWWAQHKCAPVKWLITVHEHTFPFKLRESRKQKSLQRQPEKGTPCPRIWGEFYDN